jgi:OPA family glycerol-3-phosphate transporter-like MFS transporter
VPTSAESQLIRWQVVTGAALLVGYSGYYICRSNLSVAVPALVADPAAGVDRVAIGVISSAGILAYAAGKSITGVAGDFLGGRNLFLGGLFLSVAATLAFSASAGLPLFLICWMINRFVQSAGWAGLTKTAAHWYPARRYGTVMSLLSLSFLFGDAAGRYALGGLLTNGATWRGLFVAAACVLGVIGVLVAVTLRGSPREVGLPEPAVNADNIFGESGAASAPDGLADLLKPYFASPSFWLVCGLSFGMTLIREAFNTWIPVYLSDAHHLAQGAAAQYSAIFPLLGGVSAIAVGVMTDRLRSGNRVALMVPAMALCAVSLGGLAIATSRENLPLSMLAIAATAFCLLGPYTLLAGAIAMDMGGRKGSATAAGLIDTAGYAGGTLSGIAVGGLAQSGGWAAVFNVMALLAAGVGVIAAAYCVEHRRHLAWRAEAQPGSL